MPFHSHIGSVSILPHVLSRIDPVDKNNYRKKYQKIKKYGTVAVLSGVGTIEGTQLAKDIISSKLKAYGYKSLFAIVSGPIIQFVSLPFYICSYISKIRKFAMAASELGAKITRGEMGIVNWACIGLDVVLFGEPVPITEDCDFLIIHNETASQLAETLGELVD